MDAGIDSLMMWAETEPLVRDVEAGEPFKGNSESWGWPGLVGSGVLDAEVASVGIVTQERLFCRTPMLNRISDYFAGASSERQAQKKTSEDVFLCIWWSRGDLN